ncbi:MAG: hypothetical protein M1404_05345 [Acidobacteria bacterium]|nr:hypothetical protein [Acidobacteriota bacterium]
MSPEKFAQPGNAMTSILKRKTKLIFETPFLIGRRPMTVLIEAHGLRVRPKRSRHAFEISWAQIFNRAATIAAEATIRTDRTLKNADAGNRSRARR